MRPADRRIQGPELVRAGLVGVIQVQELGDVPQGKAKPLAAQDQHMRARSRWEYTRVVPSGAG